MSRILLVLALTLALSNLPGAVTGSGVLPQGAILNGDFELVDDPSYHAKCAVFGDQSVQVFPPGSGLPWLVGHRPCNRSATSWSNSLATQFQRVGSDRAAVITPGVTDPVVGASHNLWQTFGTPTNQAYTGNFDALAFDVEYGTIPAQGFVQISFSTTPLESQHPWVGIFIECSLTLRDFVPLPYGGTHRADPTKGHFFSRYVECDEAAAAWATADPTERRDILGRLRIVQVSFWAFETGDAPIVLDNVALEGVTTVAEEAARQGVSP